MFTADDFLQIEMIILDLNTLNLLVRNCEGMNMPKCLHLKLTLVNLAVKLTEKISISC